MKRKFLTTLSLLALCVMTLTITINVGRAQRSEFESPRQPDSGVLKPLVSPSTPAQDSSTYCAIQPEKNRSSRPTRPLSPLAASNPVTLLRFRQVQLSSAPGTSLEPAAFSQNAIRYSPREQIVLIDPSNYGDRFLLDVNGKPVNNDPVVVLHETVASASSTLNFFRTPHPNDNDQASYHTLITRDGSVIYLVPPDKRAFGAGNSIFVGNDGPEAVKTHPKFPPSVNNFAYHIALESPPDGLSNTPSHSGYTAAQYQSLAWLVAKTGIPDGRITTHRIVDRSRSRMDPRSFSFPRFFKTLQTYVKTNEIAIRCTVPPDFNQSRQPTPAKTPTQQSSTGSPNTRNQRFRS